jgi:uncharacterized protein (DUF2147 family)
MGASSTEGVTLSGLTAAAATPETAAERSAVILKERLLPAGCVQTTVTGAVLKAVFDKCTGPHGLVKVTGEATVTFTSGADGITGDLKATGISVNRYTMDIESKILRRLSAGMVVLDVTTKGSGTGPHNRTLTRSGTYKYTYDPATDCRTVEGTWTTVRNDQTWETKVTGHKRCGKDCPLSGGKTTISNAGTGKSVTVSHDGTGTAKWEASGGRNGSLEMYCGGNI